MISRPYERSSLRVQNIQDVTPGREVDLVFDVATDGTLLFSTNGGIPTTPILVVAENSTALYVNVDKEGVVPMVVREQGYEWVPVYTRKLT